MLKRILAGAGALAAAVALVAGTAGAASASVGYGHHRHHHHPSSVPGVTLKSTVSLVADGDGTFATPSPLVPGMTLTQVGTGAVFTVETVTYGPVNTVTLSGDPGTLVVDAEVSFLPSA